MAVEGVRSLQGRLANALPEGCRFTLHHLCSPPTETAAIFAPLPKQRPELTYREDHILSISIDHRGQPLQVFAIEVFIYTTERLTTVFVSKADSTGYLYLLDLPKKIPSPLRIICTAFLRFLIDERQRPDRKLVLSLFARAQDQYLFPGSIENRQKHVLDDRNLIRWWCKVADPLLMVHGKDPHGSTAALSRGCLRVPGCEEHETRRFFPQEERGRIDKQQRWIVGDPLQDIAGSATLPERCLIPRFPDDPKCRLLIDLDDELPTYERDNPIPLEEGERTITPRADPGSWRSVKSLDQFWERMSVQQECNAGRLVGFLWALFSPRDFLLADASNHTADLATPLEPKHQEIDSMHRQDVLLPPDLPSAALNVPQSLRHSSQEPPTPSSTKTRDTQKIKELPEETKYYLWPPSSRGELVLPAEDYTRVGNLLLQLDYANEDIAIDSTRKLIDSVAELAKVESWGKTVVGKNKVVVTAPAPAVTEHAPAMLVGRKKKKRSAEDVADGSKLEQLGSVLHDLSADLVRKKAKTEDSTEEVVTKHA